MENNSFKTNTTRRKIIDACVERGFSVEDANIKLRENNLHEIIDKTETDWYEMMRQNYINTSLRKKLIENGKKQALSRFEINTILQKNNLRCLNEYETMDYMDTLGRKKVVNSTSLKALLGEEDKLSRENIIQNSLKTRKILSEVNILLRQNNYDVLSEEEENKYKKIFNSSNRSRESIILDAIKNNIKTSELNRTLRNSNLSPLSQFETLDYEQRKFLLQQQRRDHLIKECTEERKYTDEINDLLRKYNFDELTEIEEKKIRQLYKTEPGQNGLNQLSPQFQALYKEAIKRYHPDIFNDPNDKLVANKRMKEINEAKNNRDYFRLRGLVEEFEREDQRKEQA